METFGRAEWAGQETGPQPCDRPTPVVAGLLTVPRLCDQPTTILRPSSEHTAAEPLWHRFQRPFANLGVRVLRCLFKQGDGVVLRFAVGIR